MPITGAELAPPGAGERCSASSGSSATDHRGGATPSPALDWRGVLASADQHAPGAGLERGGRELAAVRARAGQAHEEVARAGLAESITTRARPRPPGRRPRAGAGGLGDRRGRSISAALGRTRRAAPRAPRSRRRTAPCGRPRTPGPARGPCPRPRPRRRARPVSTARAIAPRRSTSRSAPAPAPSMISSMIASGSSERGLSEVTITRSASRARRRPSAGAWRGRGRRRRRTPRCSRPCVSSRAARSTFSSESGVCA